MSILKTSAALIAALLFGAGSAHASGGLHAVFADCTGKLSAQLEHEWLMSDEGAAETQQTLAQFQDLLQATTPPDERRSTLHRRIEAKLSHSAVLTRATFNADREDARWAYRRAEASIVQCTNLLLRG